MSVIECIRETLREESLDAILITNPYNRYYVTQFTGSSGVALITTSDAFFITDFRYTEQAKDEVQSFTIIEHRGSFEIEVQKVVKETGLKRIGFEEEHVTYAQFRRLTDTINATLVPTKQIVESLRMIKTDAEIKKIERAARIADEAFEHILPFIKPGVVEKDIALELEYFMRKRGASAASFDIIVASGERSALPHGIASNKKIESGELVTLDFGAVYERYVSDITRTVAVGQVSDQLKKIYEIVQRAQQIGTERIKANMTGKEADRTTREYIEEQGYGEYFGHATGHAIGLEVHENPGLSPRSHVQLKENMVVTVEPGIYIPQVGGCRIEDDIVLKQDGNICLTTSTKEFIQL